MIFGRPNSVVTVAAGYTAGAAMCTVYLVWTAKVHVAIITQCWSCQAWACVVMMLFEVMIYVVFGYKFSRNAVRVWDGRGPG